MTRADEKNSLGFSVLANSDNGTKRKRTSQATDDSGDESETLDLSAAFRSENKVPVECPVFSSIGRKIHTYFVL